MSDRELFDAQNFLNSLANDPDLARDLLLAFLDDSPERSATLSEQIAANDLAMASRTAHSLKGMCGVVRAPKLMELALGMEDAGKAGDGDGIRELYSAFETELARAHEIMRTFMSSL